MLFASCNAHVVPYLNVQAEGVNPSMLAWCRQLFIFVQVVISRKNEPNDTTLEAKDKINPFGHVCLGEVVV